MKKLIAASFASILIIGSMTQIATAAERTTKHHTAAATSERVRNAHASVAPFYVPAQENFSGAGDEALSPPAGR